MNVRRIQRKPARIEMLPLIDIVFLLLVVFIYALLSMAVHRGLPVALPDSDTAETETAPMAAVTVMTGGTLYLDKQPVTLIDLENRLRTRGQAAVLAGVQIFADKTVTYQVLFDVLDRIKSAGIEKISMQAVQR